MSSPAAPDAVAAQKTSLRDHLVTQRRRRPLLEISSAASAIAEHVLEIPEVRRAATVAAYVSVAGEPGTGPLLEAFAARGVRVILPVLLPDRDLDWAAYTGPGGLRSARMGLLEPVGPALGVDAIATADVVLCPGQAVDRTGMRLGHGAGCYDRALSRVPVGTLVCVLLYDEEVLDRVPAADHDRRVTAVATERGVTRFPTGRA
jgi:5-formyltetrahydrofolate cyclo-ligase